MRCYRAAECARRCGGAALGGVGRAGARPGVTVEEAVPGAVFLCASTCAGNLETVLLFLLLSRPACYHVAPCCGLRSGWGCGAPGCWRSPWIHAGMSWSRRGNRCYKEQGAMLATGVVRPTNSGSGGSGRTGKAGLSGLDSDAWRRRRLPSSSLLLAELEEMQGVGLKLLLAWPAFFGCLHF